MLIRRYTFAPKLSRFVNTRAARLMQWDFSSGGMCDFIMSRIRFVAPHIGVNYASARVTVQVFLLASSVIINVAVANAQSAKDQSHLPHAMQGQISTMRLTDPPGTIDGSVTPDLIPDNTAYTLFLRAIAESSSPTEAQRVRQKAKLAPIGLSADDYAVITTITGKLFDRLMAINAARSLHSASTDSEEKATQDTVNALNSSLSPDGLKRLEAHIKAEKKRMKLYPMPPGMTTSN